MTGVLAGCFAGAPGFLLDFTHSTKDGPIATVTKSRKKSDEKTLPPVDCDSLADVDRLLGDLGSLDQLEAKVQARFQAKQDSLTADFKGSLVITIDGEPIGIEDRRKQVHSALASWCEAHREEILLDDLKSRELNFGTVGWRKSPDSISNLKGQPAKGNKTLLEKVIGHLRRALLKFSDVAAALGDCLAIKADWSKDKLAAALKDGKINAADLRAIGFRQVTGEEEFFAEPLERKLESLES
jgi:hypothetical protein